MLINNKRQVVAELMRSDTSLRNRSATGFYSLSIDCLLFSGEKYYKLDEHFRVMKGYPKQTSLFWGKVPYCGSANDKLTEDKHSAAAAKSVQKTCILVLMAYMTSLIFIH